MLKKDKNTCENLQQTDMCELGNGILVLLFTLNHKKNVPEGVV